MVRLSRQAREAARRAAEELWDGLGPAERWELGDAFVLGTFDWMDWWNDPPPPGTARQLDRIRTSWEEA